MDPRLFWQDDQIVVDKDGIPHYTGARPELMKDYCRTVLFAFSKLEGSGDDEAKQKKSFEKKQRRFAKSLMDNLHDEAWRACQERPRPLITSSITHSPNGPEKALRVSFFDMHEREKATSGNSRSTGRAVVAFPDDTMLTSSRRKRPGRVLCECGRG